MRTSLVASATATAAALLLTTVAIAPASTSHEGWPKIDGELKMHKNDQDGPINGTDKSDELLGGHGDDDIDGGEAADVLWGDYKPGGQPTSQWDHLAGGDGNDFIYASHGRNTIDAGSGKDTIHAHFGRGVIDCGGGADVLYISHKAQKKYKISHCETISYKTVGY
jgi:Ca2+-binding RTX toxin-like protein